MPSSSRTRRVVRRMLASILIIVLPVSGIGCAAALGMLANLASSLGTFIPGLRSIAGPLAAVANIARIVAPTTSSAAAVAGSSTVQPTASVPGGATAPAVTSSSSSYRPDGVLPSADFFSPTVAEPTTLLVPTGNPDSLYNPANNPSSSILDPSAPLTLDGGNPPAFQ